MRSLSDFVEPWVPEVGQRVRVVNRPECEYCEETGAAEAGATGTVEEAEHSEFMLSTMPNGPIAQAHHYWVKFDSPVPTETDGTPIEINHFAAIELEAIS